MYKVVAVSKNETGGVTKYTHQYLTLKEAVNAANTIEGCLSDNVSVFNKEGNQINFN